MKKTNRPSSIVKKLRNRYTQKEIADHLGVNSRTIRRWEIGESTPKPYALPLLAKMIRQKNRSTGDISDFTFIDLFAGIGGTRLGFEAHGGECVFSSEWDSYCVKTYVKNFGENHSIVGDIKKINEKDIPDHDLLLAGFPCQPFSIAGVSKKNALGKKHGFLCKTQGTLFFDVARIINEKRPKAFLLENVKHLLNHDKGRTFKTILETLEKQLGYELHYRIIDAQHYVPQHRERIFIVGFNKSTNFSWDDLKLHAITENSPKMKDILHPENGSEEPEGHFTYGKKARVNEKYVLSDHLWKYLKNYAIKHKARGNGFGFGLVGANDVARTLSARYYKDGSEILVSRGKNSNPRRLTPRECSRLMGFDTQKSKFNISVSDTQAYKQFGNSVVVPVVKEVARIMKPHIMALVKKEMTGVVQIPMKSNG